MLQADESQRFLHSKMAAVLLATKAVKSIVESQFARFLRSKMPPLLVGGKSGLRNVKDVSVTFLFQTR